MDAVPPAMTTIVLTSSVTLYFYKSQIKRKMEYFAIFALRLTNPLFPTSKGFMLLVDDESFSTVQPLSHTLYCKPIAISMVKATFPSSTSSDFYRYDPSCHVHIVKSSLFSSYFIKKNSHSDYLPRAIIL